MVDFGGWDMPVQYTGIVDEHNTVRTAVGLFDVSHMGEIEIRGPEALKLVDHVSTNAAGRLAIGQAHYSGLLYEHGGFVDDILVHKVADDSYFLCVNASNQEKDFEHILAHNTFDCQVDFASARYAQIAVQGPRALEVLSRLTDLNLSAIRYYWFVDGVVAGFNARVARTGYTGEDGFEIYLAPGFAADLWNQLIAAGADYGIKPCGLGARNTLRLEAAMSLYGHEIGASITPFDAGLGWIVKMDKGDFIGRDALAKQRERGLTRALAGFEMRGRGIARDGYDVFDGDGKQIGYVTSGSPAPFLKKNIALAYVPPTHTAIDSEVFVQVRTNLVRAKVVPLPFYKRPKKQA